MTRRRIKDMGPGEVGFTMPWAYDAENWYLDEDFPIVGDKGGTYTLHVKCVKRGEYAIDFG